MRDQGRVGEAYELLAPVYGWFTEGFGTKDLKEAKQLLDELTWAGLGTTTQSGADDRFLGNTVIRCAARNLS
jgi:hypothetical protein